MQLTISIQQARQRDGVLHRQLRSGADREMRRVRGVADKDNVPVVPTLVGDAREAEPWRIAQMRWRVVDQRMSGQPWREQLLARGDRLRNVHPVEASGAP